MLGKVLSFATFGEAAFSLQWCPRTLVKTKQNRQNLLN